MDIIILVEAIRHKPMHKRIYYLVNGITMYRLLVTPVLVYLIIKGEANIFKWLLPVSFFTDAIDGYLARKYEATSVFGSRLDSVADDLTILSAIIAVLVFKPEFIKQERVVISCMLCLYLFQTIYALVKYRKFSSFHTYSAKVAAVSQGIFLILFFLLREPLYWLFYLTSSLTLLDLVEETILVFMLPSWRSDVKGVYWLFGKRKKYN